jgi:hypothetical protein
MKKMLFESFKYKKKGEKNPVGFRRLRTQESLLLYFVGHGSGTTNVAASRSRHHTEFDGRLLCVFNGRRRTTTSSSAVSTPPLDCCVTA